MNVPAEPGSYALRMRLLAPVRQPVGRLGSFSFPPGNYLYLGSAFGPGGLQARLRHHARVSAKPHWHLDALRPHVTLQGGWYCTGARLLECIWSQSLVDVAGVLVPAPGFGASDCRMGCPSHLLALPAELSWPAVEEILRAAAGLPLAHFEI